jgi:hypothetical protein
MGKPTEPAMDIWDEEQCVGCGYEIDACRCEWPNDLDETDVLRPLCACGREMLVQCECCGAPLCGMCSEVGAGFCGNGCPTEAWCQEQQASMHAELLAEEQAERVAMWGLADVGGWVNGRWVGPLPSGWNLTTAELDVLETQGLMDDLPF